MVHFIHSFKRKPVHGGFGFGFGFDTHKRVRARVQDLLNRFRKRCREMKATKLHTSRVDLKVLKEFRKEESMFLSLIGSVPGVEVGDRFQYRAELRIAGLHRSLQKGIDCIEYDQWGERKVASCVVANEGHYNNMLRSDVLLYAGEGRRRADRAMKGGNLAMKNSIDVKNEVRVLRGLKVVGGNEEKIVYVYDGLYHVVGWKPVKGKNGNEVIEFEMRRKLGQPSVNWKRLSCVGVSGLLHSS